MHAGACSLEGVWTLNLTMIGHITTPLTPHHATHYHPFACGLVESLVFEHRLPLHDGSESSAIVRARSR